MVATVTNVINAGPEIWDDDAMSFNIQRVSYDLARLRLVDHRTGIEAVLKV